LYDETHQPTLVFAKAGRTKALFQLFVFQFGFISGRRITIQLYKSSTSIYKFSFRQMGGRKSISQPSQIPARCLQ